jgi:hypothetical protein
MSSIRYSCHALPKLQCSRHILKNTQISYFVKIWPVGATLFGADGQTEMTKLIVAFRNFVKAPKNKNT